jgi:hypothetical protein
MSAAFVPALAVATGIYLLTQVRRHMDPNLEENEDSASDDERRGKPRPAAGLRAVPPRRRVYFDHDYAQYANDPTVRRGRAVDKSLYGVSDQEQQVIPVHAADTIPIDPVGDPLWRNRRRGRMILSRDEREVVPLVQSQYQVPYAMADDSDLRSDALRKAAMDRVPQHQELRWDDVALAPLTTEWKPDPNLLLQSVAFKQSRRLLGDTSIDTGFRARAPIPQPDESGMQPPKSAAVLHMSRRQDQDVRNVNSKLPATYGISV